MGADAAFRPGVELAASYYLDVVRPLLEKAAPGLVHSAGLLGWGSDVLGFDTPRSTDHNWGPRCQVFVGPADAGRIADLDGLLTARLPEAFGGWPTAFCDAMVPASRPRHWVELHELGGWLLGRLGFDPRAGLGLLDWLATPTQLLAEVTGGAVFHDGLGDGPQPVGSGLHAARAALAWYPDDIWRYVLACQWRRIAQEEAFPGRCAEAGDDVGAVIVTARLARDLIRLTLLMNRRYPPYSKWLGSEFARLPAAAGLRDRLAGALSAASWPASERGLCAAYEHLGRLHNDLGLTPPVDVTVRRFHERPYLVADAERYETALRSAITDPAVRRLPPFGAIDQFIDNTDVAGDAASARAAVGGCLRNSAIG